MMHTKEFTARVKAVGKADGLEDDGQFEAIVSVFGNKDSVGDVVIPGAFADDLKAWKDSGDPIPVIWSHDWANPESHIGVVLDSKETDEGLWVKGQLDLDNPRALQVYRLLKGRRVKQFSFAYDILDGGWGERDGEDVYELRKMHVFEVGPTLVGANQATDLLAVKAQELARGVKAGRVLSAKNYDLLVAARDSLDSVLSAATPVGEDDPEKASASTGAEKTQEPSQVSESPASDEEPPGEKSSAEGSDYAPRRALAVARIATL